MKKIDKYFEDKFETKTSGNWMIAFPLFAMSWVMWEDFSKVGATFVFAAGMITTYLCFRKYESRTQGIVSEKKIYSLGNKTMTSGAFILGTGGFDSEDYYVFYTDGEYGGLVKEKASAEDTELFMRDDIEPCLREIMCEDEDGFSETKEFLFVPKNTVKKNIKIIT